MSTRLSDEHCRQFREQGFCILPDCVPPEHLAILRGACEDAMAATDRRLDAEGTDVSGINHRGKRYFSTNTSLLHPELFDFIHSELMADSCRRLIGPDAWVFHEQYVVKCPGGESSFSWHQDSGYVGADTPHRPYLTCWVALDEITADNGTVFMLPYERAGVRERVDHRSKAGSNDLVGYQGDDPGEPVTCPAGSIAFFSSVTFHRSGANTTDRLRRVYLIQYSPELIRRPDGTPWSRGERFLSDGRVVAERPDAQERVRLPVF